MNSTGKLKSSSSELDLDQPNIEDYLPTGASIQQEPRGKLRLYALYFSMSCLYCYLDTENKWAVKKKQFFIHSIFLENGD